MEKPTWTRSRACRPDLDRAEDRRPQPRSTVGTITEVYDYLRLLWARLGTPHCPKTAPHRAPDRLADHGSGAGLPEGTKLEVLARWYAAARANSATCRGRQEAGFVRVRVDGETYDLAQAPKLNRRQNHDIAVVVDRLVVRRTDRARLADSIETALKAADGR